MLGQAGPTARTECTAPGADMQPDWSALSARARAILCETAARVVHSNEDSNDKGLP
jgi:hypothetical protein